MAKKWALVLGGARSGKSDFAQKLALDWGGQVLFVATAQAGDEEMRRRIQEHQRSRPASWRTVEETARPTEAITAHQTDAQVVLVDCMTLWLANLYTGSVHQEETPPPELETMVFNELGNLHDWFRASSASLITVSNEVGMGIVPPTPLGRAYRDLLGRVNQFLGVRADEVYLLVAGIPIELKRLTVTPWRQEP